MDEGEEEEEETQRLLEGNALIERLRAADSSWHLAQIEKLRAATDRAPLWREVADRIGWPGGKGSVISMLGLAGMYQEALELPQGGFRAELIKLEPDPSQ